MAEVWLNGAFVPAGNAIDAADRGLLLADGLFDTALLIDGVVFRRNDHLARLADGLAQLSIPVAQSNLEAAMTALAARQGDGSIRLSVTRGPGPRGLQMPAEPRPTILGTAAPLAPTSMFAPLRLAAARIRRNETSPLSRLKSLSYLDAVLAQNEAKAAGADEALFLNTAGHVACTALGNLFALKDGHLSTPPLADGVLPGIMRRWILAQAEDAGLAIAERSLVPADLAGASLFVSNSLRLIAPASLGDEVPVALPDPLRLLMERLCKAVAAECGRDPRELGARLPD
ncbi:aminotransferase class IV [Mangrovicella endophytica]|uniref:aminotransferase class IV n=1 Tax=Mangrovicella endophytica TaxID=2066697 RepID=UPI000C9E8D10|nr:aminotransferase class IV [Mangrovicella endophytica]